MFKKYLICVSYAMFFFFTPSHASNRCVDEIESHTKHNLIQLNRCQITDDEITKILNYINNTPCGFGWILELDSNFITDKGAKQLAENPLIVYLILSKNRIGDEGAYALAKNTDLLSLDLSGNDLITDRGVSALAQFIGRADFLELYLMDHKIGDEGLIALANTKKRAYLHLSYLDERNIKYFDGNTTLIMLEIDSATNGDEVAIALAKNTNLGIISLPNSKITDKGAIALATNNGIGRLYLVNNRITDIGAIALAQSSLSELSLQGNKITDRGAGEFVFSTLLTLLDLSNNYIGNDGASILSYSKTIINLNLSFNIISDAGAIALAKNRPDDSYLRLLDVSFNLIGTKGLKALKDSGIDVVILDGNNEFAKKKASK
jgi:Leucine-rich repeat (LRR) protein